TTGDTSGDGGVPLQKIVSCLDAELQAICRAVDRQVKSTRQRLHPPGGLQIENTFKIASGETGKRGKTASAQGDVAVESQFGNLASQRHVEAVCRDNRVGQIDGLSRPPCAIDVKL